MDDPKFSTVVDPAKGPQALTPGQVITVHKTPLTIIHHIDSMPGHYLAVPDMSNQTRDLDVCAARVVFHGPTKRWLEGRSRLPDWGPDQIAHFSRLRQEIDDEDEDEDEADET